MRIWHRVVTLCLIALLSGAAGCSKPPAPTSLTGEAMATTWTLQIADPITQAQATEVETLIHQEFQSVVQAVSHWQKDSDLSRWNRSLSTGWQSVPEPLVEMVKVAQKIGRETEGALDITAAPLVELWGFGPTPRREALPSQEEISHILRQVGWQHLELNPEARQLRKDQPEVQINVASVTEGYVMDRLITMLKAKGIQHFLLEVGGEVAAVGHPPEGGPWRVGIQAPDQDKGASLESLPLSDLCIATSGSYRHRYEKDDHSYSHILDPRAGRPIEHKLVSVSVIHPSCILADGYATALMVLGPVEGREVAERLGLRVIWLEEP